jgi:hypothetical protein
MRMILTSWASERILGLKLCLSHPSLHHLPLRGTLMKTSIANNTRANGHYNLAPAFVPFRPAPKPTDPALITIP